MALTVANVILRAQLTYPDITDAVALNLLNDEWAELAGKYNLLDGDYWQALSEDDREMALAENVARIEKVYYYSSALTYNPLRVLHEEELDKFAPSWRDDLNGIPAGYGISGEISSNTGAQSIFLHPKPNATTLAVSGATNATPIVITTSTVHGLTDDGTAVRLDSVGGNTNANGLRYADILSTTTFALYSDEDLTTAVAGNSNYTSGGIVVTDSSPALHVFVQRSSTFVTTDTIPNVGPNSDIFVWGINWRYADALLGPDERDRSHRRYNQARQEFEEFRTSKLEGAGVRIRPFHSVSRKVF